MKLDRENLRTRAYCLWHGHEKRWIYTVFTPTWECERCGATGDLDSHRRLPFRYHFFALIPTVIVGIILIMLLF